MSVINQRVESVRIRAEKERIKKCREVLVKSATFYYRTMVSMILRNVPKSDAVQTFAGYMKSVIESGESFGNTHLMYILSEISPGEKMGAEELEYVDRTKGVRFFVGLCKDMGVEQGNATLCRLQEACQKERVHSKKKPGTSAVSEFAAA